MAISIARLHQLVGLIQVGKAQQFYFWPEWERLRLEVLRFDHYECQRCKERGRYRKANIVHHVKHLKDRPDLALSLYDDDTGERQLVSVCKTCHEDLHPESKRQYTPKKTPVTIERWD